MDYPTRRLGNQLCPIPMPQNLASMFAGVINSDAEDKRFNDFIKSRRGDPIIDNQIMNCGSLNSDDKLYLLNMVKFLMDPDNSCKLDSNAGKTDRNLVKVDVTNNRNNKLKRKKKVKQNY